MIDKKPMSLWGVGPIFTIISVLITIASIVIHKRTYLSFNIEVIPSIVFKVFGISFMMLGFIIWFSGTVLARIDKNIKEDKLVTTGIYAYVRNPIYSGIWFFLTGILIIYHSYIMVGLPILFYILLRILVKKEEKVLTERFGQEYLKYKKNTNAVFPTVRL